MYSQGAEEQAILAAVGEEPGRFLDLGAYHAFTFSNTRALFERGWGGVFVEAGPSQSRGLIEEYGNEERVAVLQAAVGPTNGIVKIHATDDATSTTDTEHYRKWSKICAFYGSYWIPTVTVADILNQWGAFDFVSIDVEGISSLIFRQLLDTAMRPRAICVEHDGDLPLLESLARGKGYQLVFKNGENAVFKLQ